MINSNELKIAIVGYGRMGREVELIAQSQNIAITDKFDLDNIINIEKKYNFDVAVVFDRPSSVMENIKKLATLKKNMVIGTTGWYDHMSEVQQIIDKKEISLVWGSNFSIGMNLFFKIVSHASELINRFDDYDVFLHEIHHTMKEDSPSGSAKTIAKLVLDAVERKTKIETEAMHEKISQSSLHVTSTRGGSVAGTHILTMDSEADYLEMKHVAKNRSGFAAGAVEAAKRAKELKGIHEFKDLIFS